MHVHKLGTHNSSSSTQSDDQTQHKLSCVRGIFHITPWATPIVSVSVCVCAVGSLNTIRRRISFLPMDVNQPKYIVYILVEHSRTRPLAMRWNMLQNKNVLSFLVNVYCIDVRTYKVHTYHLSYKYIIQYEYPMWGGASRRYGRHITSRQQQ